MRKWWHRQKLEDEEGWILVDDLDTISDRKAIEIKLSRLVRNTVGLAVKKGGGDDLSGSTSPVRR